MLDAAVAEYIDNKRSSANDELARLAELSKMWALRKPVLDARVSVKDGP